MRGLAELVSLLVHTPRSRCRQHVNSAVCKNTPKLPLPPAPTQARQTAEKLEKQKLGTMWCDGLRLAPSPWACLMPSLRAARISWRKGYGKLCRNPLPFQSQISSKFYFCTPRVKFEPRRVGLPIEKQVPGKVERGIRSQQAVRTGGGHLKPAGGD